MGGGWEMLNRLQVRWLSSFFVLSDKACAVEQGAGGNCRNWGRTRDTNSSVRMEIGSVIECTLVCWRRLTATRSGVHQGTTQGGRNTCFRVKLSRLKPWYWLAVWCRTKQSDSLSSLSLSSERRNIISLSRVKSFLGPPKMTSTRALWMIWTSLVTFQETKAGDLSAWWPFQEESIATPPFSAVGAVDQLQPS